MEGMLGDRKVETANKLIRSRMLKNIRSLDTLASPEKAEYCIYETPTANDSKLEESSDEKKPDKVNDSGFSYILQTIFTLM